MDQANDAIHVREILVDHKLLLRGPETSIFGIYAGPLWYYFIAVGYALFGGHPFGGVFMLIILNVFTLFIIIRRISKEISPMTGIVTGAFLQVSWWFYDLSRYSFNPFPNFFLSVVGIFWLTDFLRGKTESTFWRPFLWLIFPNRFGSSYSGQCSVCGPRSCTNGAQKAICAQFLFGDGGFGFVIYSPCYKRI